MRFFNSTWAIVISVVLLIALLWGVLLYFENKASIAALDPYSFVPADAFLLVDLKNPQGLPANILENNWAGEDDSLMFGTISLKSNLEHLDTIMAGSNAPQDVFSKARLLISAHLSVAGEVQILFNLRFAKTYNFRSVQVVVSELFPGLESKGSYEFLDATINESGVPGKQTFFYSYFNGSLLMSYSQRLIEHSVTQFYSERGIENQPGFDRLRKVAGQRADNIFFDGSRFCDVMALAGNFNSMLFLPCNSLPGWMAWDVVLLADEIRFSGLGHNAADGNSFLNAFTRTPYADNRLPDYIPSTAAAFSMISIAEPDTFFKRWHSFGNLTNNTQPGLNTESGEEFPYPAITEMAVVQPFEPGAQLDSTAVYLVYLPKGNGSGVIAKSMSESDSLLLTEFKGISEQPIYFDQKGGMMSNLTHGVFPADLPYLVSVDSVIMASRSLLSLRNYFLQVEYGQVLTRGDDYNSRFNFLQPASNVLYYVNFPSLRLLSRALSPQAANSLNDNVINENLPVQGLTFQLLAHQQELVFSNGILNRIVDSGGIMASAIWEVKLDTLLQTAPYNVINHNDGSVEIIVQDKLNNLYLIDRFGNVLWKKELSGPIMSAITQVDRYKNNRLQYIFNTRNFIHLLDRNGEYANGYPVRIPSAATAGISVFDYEQNKDYRVMFPGEDRIIYNFTVEGRQVRGWARPKTAHIVNQPVSFLQLGGLDYIAGIDSIGTPYFFDRRGSQRIKLKQQANINPPSGIFPLGEKPNYRFVAAGLNQSIIEIYPDGRIIKMEIDSLESPYNFNILKGNDTSSHLLIFSNSFSITGYNYLAEKVMEIKPPEKLMPEISCIYMADNSYIVTVSQESGQLFFYDASGTFFPFFSLTAFDGFFINQMMRNQTQYLVSGSEGKIYCYSLGTPQ